MPPSWTASTTSARDVTRLNRPQFCGLGGLGRTLLKGRQAPGSSMVKNCDVTSKRLVCSIGPDTPTPGAVAYISCLGATMHWARAPTAVGTGRGRLPTWLSAAHSLPSESGPMFVARALLQRVPMHRSARALFLRFRSVDKLARGPVNCRSAAAAWLSDGGRCPLSRGAPLQATPTVLGLLKEFFQ
jgi:hypothetical protein